jgi:hypothetical protein
MSYNTGLIKYVVKGPFTNPIAFYIYGAGILALLNAVPHLAGGGFVQALVDYFVTKYLPPTSVVQVVTQIVVGSVTAGLKWFFLTPR